MKNLYKPEEIPIFERYQEIQAERDQYKEALKELYDPTKDQTFKPKINEKSRKMVKKKEKRDVVSRLMERGKEIEEKKEKLKQARLVKEKMMRKIHLNNSDDGK